MSNLATDILRAEKKKATFWKVSTIVTFTIALAELVVIAF